LILLVKLRRERLPDPESRRRRAFFARHPSRKVLSFRAFNDSSFKPDPPVEVILVIDTEH
jgi:hypothetical protein